MSTKTDETFSRDAVEEHSLSEEERVALAAWFLGGLEVKVTNPLEFAGMGKNCERWARMYGIKIVASMSHRGLLKPGHNPYDAFRDLLCLVEEKEQRIQELEHQLNDNDND